MKIKNYRDKLAIIVIICFFLSSSISALGVHEFNKLNDPGKKVTYLETSTMDFEFDFSDPTFEENGEYVNVYIEQSDFNHIADGTPVLPVKLVVQEFTFGTEIISVDYEISTPETISISKKISFGKCSPRGTQGDSDIYDSSNLYPVDWVTYHTGGGLSFGEHKTFLSIRIYPIRYSPMNDEIQNINHISLSITYEEPERGLLNDRSDYDLLILAPSSFKNSLNPLVTHKNNMGVNTILVELSDVYDEMSSQGRDKQEQIKYYIKHAIETWGIKYVLLVGGLNGQTFSWSFPIRSSHVVPPDEQEYAEESFITDLYYADIYDSMGSFSSWDTNENDIFSEWDEINKDEMDLYPDVYFGRLACRYNFEVTTMVNKIINYEEEKCGSWFDNVALIAGDSYNDSNGYNEGELICEEAYSKLPGFNPVRLYAAEDKDINRDTVKEVIDPGSGFAFFCGHGNPGTWATHFPPNAEGWVTGFDSFDMIHLKNKHKLPIAVVGGCRNSEFDVTILNLFKGFQDSIRLANWLPRCWNWWFTCKINGGAIASIGSTGLGTHGREDTDNNNIADYLEVLDGWMELRFFELYGIENNKILGENYGQTLTEYLNIFLGSNEKMDVKMVQQWVLFGDPNLQIGGYE